MIELTGKIIDLSLDFMSGKPKLTLEINGQQAAKCLYDEYKQEEKISIKFSRYRKKRSINANNYAWKLITELAKKMNITKEEVYRQHIKDIGVFRQVEIDEKAVDTLIHSWGLHGIGWFCEKVDYTQHDGFVLINLYYGSSTYNTRQMSRLIDNIVQDCKAVGIPTETPEEINKMLSLWKAGEVNE